MPTPVSDTIKEVEATSKLIRGVGPITTLSVAVLVLCVALGFSMVTAKVGADRWTRTDHMDYVYEHDADKHKTVSELLDSHNEVHREEGRKDDEMVENLSTIQVDVAVLKATVKRIEQDLQVIKSAVVSIERNGNH